MKDREKVEGGRNARPRIRTDPAAANGRRARPRGGGQMMQEGFGTGNNRISRSSTAFLLFGENKICDNSIPAGCAPAPIQSLH